MPLTNAGRDFMAQAIVNDTPTFFNNANARLGVGDSSTAFAATQTDLQAATNKVRVGMDATYPQRTTNVLTFKSTFDGATANWTWNEWGVFNAAAAETMLNRLVEANGTKTTGQTWVLTATITNNIGA